MLILIKITIKLLKEIFGANDLFSSLGKILGIFSILALLKHAFKVGFSQVFLLLVKYYNTLVRTLLGWTEPFFSFLITEFNRTFNFHFKILPHWRHIFVLLCIYFVRVGVVSYSYGYKKTGYFIAVWGTIIAIITSLFMGSIPLKGLSLKNLILASYIPIVGIFVFDFGRQLWITTFNRKRIAEIYRVPKYKWWAYFKPNLYLVLGQALGSIVFVTLCLFLPNIRNSESPVLFSFGLLIIAIAIYRIFLGMLEIPKLRKPNEATIDTFLRTNSAGLALSMFCLFFWVFVFLITSAGLQFFGL